MGKQVSESKHNSKIGKNKTIVSQHKISKPKHHMKRRTGTEYYSSKMEGFSKHKKELDKSSTVSLKRRNDVYPRLFPAQVNRPITQEKQKRAEERKKKYNQGIIDLKTVFEKKLYDDKRLKELPPEMYPNPGPNRFINPTEKGLEQRKLKDSQDKSVPQTFLDLYENAKKDKLAYNYGSGNNPTSSLVECGVADFKEHKRTYAGLKTFKGEKDGKTYVRGHQQPYIQTMKNVQAGQKDSDESKRNYSPEQGYWGKQVRRRIETLCRKEHQKFVQDNILSDQATTSGYQIPSKVRIHIYSKDNKHLAAYEFDFSNDYSSERKRKGSMDKVIQGHKLDGVTERKHAFVLDAQKGTGLDDMRQDDEDFLSDDEDMDMDETSGTDLAEKYKEVMTSKIKTIVDEENDHQKKSDKHENTSMIDEDDDVSMDDDDDDVSMNDDIDMINEDEDTSMIDEGTADVETKVEFKK